MTRVAGVIDGAGVLRPGGPAWSAGTRAEGGRIARDIPVLSARAGNPELTGLLAGEVRYRLARQCRALARRDIGGNFMTRTLAQPGDAWDGLYREDLVA
jgi:hypothetical protein